MSKLKITELKSAPIFTKNDETGVFEYPSHYLPTEKEPMKLYRFQGEIVQFKIDKMLKIKDPIAKIIINHLLDNNSDNEYDSISTALKTMDEDLNTVGEEQNQINSSSIISQ